MPPVSARERRALVATMAGCSALAPAVQNAAVPVLPAIGAQLHIDTVTAGWVLTANLLSAAVLAPVIGRVSDLYGRRRVLLAALGLLVAGSVVAACVPTPPVLIAARVLQGAGGVLYPLAISVLREELPADRVPGATALVAGALGLGAGLGVVVAGVMNAVWADYRVVFAAFAVLGLLVLLAAVRTVPERGRVAGRGRVDVPGAILLCCVLVPWLVALSQGNTWGWSSGAVIGAAVAGGLGLVGFVLVERRVPDPLVDLRVLAQGPVLVVNLLAVISGALIILGRVPVSQLVQTPRDAAGYGFGASVVSASVTYLLPGLVIAVGGAVLGGVLVKRYGGRVAVAGGGVLGLVGFVGLAVLHDTTWQVIAGGAAAGAAVSLAAAAFPVLLAASVSADRFGAAGGLNALSLWVGSALASAVVTALLAATGEVRGGAYPVESDFVGVFLLGAVLSMLTVVIVIVVPGRGRRPVGAAHDRVAPGGDTGTGAVDEGPHAPAQPGAVPS